MADIDPSFLAKPAKPAKPVFIPCHGSAGRFSRCPGTPPPRRPHRRQHSAGANCACPPGAEKVPSAKGRGFACSARTKEGARFVAMKCSASGEQNPEAVPGRRLVSGTNHRDRTPETPRETPSPSSKAKRAAKIDWSRCKCPPGAEMKISAKGRTQCVARNEKGRLTFVKAVCPEGLKGLSLRGRR